MLKNKKKVEAHRTGYLGECYVMYELAKMGIRSQRMDGMVADYDLVTEFGDRIEVKTAKPHWSWNGKKTGKTLMWNFNNHATIYHFDKGNMTSKQISRRRDCDFFIFVGMNDKSKIKRVFIVPNLIVGKKKSIQEPVLRKRDGGQGSFRIYEYEGKWKLISLGIGRGKEK